MPLTDQRTNLAIVMHRESEATAMAAVSAILDSAGRDPLLLDILVNGNPALADVLVDRLHGLVGPVADRVDLRLWHIALGDKANALNQYWLHLWPGTGHACMLDGYVRIDGQAQRRLAAALDTQPQALCAAAVPTMGHSAASLRRAMLRIGGLHGNLFCLRDRTLARLRDLGFRLPVGLYRTDATLGAALSFDLDPTTQRWEPQRRIVVTESATWQVGAPAPGARAAVADHLKRRMRQARGVLENRAVHDLFEVRRQPLSALPATASALIAQWRACSPADFWRTLLLHPLAAWAYSRIEDRPAPDPDLLRPVLLLDSAAPRPH
jgi:hypothetical protein